MGGNATIHGVTSEGIDLERADIEAIRRFTGRMLIATNPGACSGIDSERIVGSAIHYVAGKDMGPKKRLGDIDILIPEGTNMKAAFEDAADFMPDQALAWHNKPDGSVLSIWRIYDAYGPNDPATVQVDFFPCPFINYSWMAERFYKFSRSAPYEDMINGIKGFHHKYLMQSLCVSKLPVKLLTPTGRISKKEFRSWYAFSVHHGLREKYQVERVEADMLIASQTPVKNSEYVTDLPTIFHTLTGSNTVHHSFISLFDAVLKMSGGRRDRIIEYYFGMLFDKGAQLIGRDNRSDMLIKLAGVQHFYHRMESRLGWKVRLMSMMQKYYNKEFKLREMSKLIEGEYE